MFRKKDIIYAIYREGGFSKAAKMLHIAQPSLSVMVAGVEKELGASLFDRSTNPVRLTDIGAKYIECCENINMIEDDFKAYMDEVRGIERGNIFIGSNSLYMSNVIPSIVARYSEKHPQIHINLYDYDTPQLISSLNSGALDLAIDNLAEDNPSLDSYYLGTEFLLFAVPLDSPVNERLSKYSYSYFDITRGVHVSSNRRDLNDLYAFRNLPFILLQDGFDTRKRVDAIFEDYGISVHADYEFNQLSSAFGMAASGIGATVVSDTLVRHSPDWGSKMRYYSLRNEEFTRAVFCYSKKNRMLGKAISEFIEISREQSPFTIFEDPHAAL